MHFGFSYVGLIFLFMLFVPNIFWTKNKPKDYDRYAENENKALLFLERTGEAAVSCLVLIFRDFNPQGLSVRLLWLAASLGGMILYELYWIRYFRSVKPWKIFTAAIPAFLWRARPCLFYRSYGLRFMGRIRFCLQPVSFWGSATSGFT